MNYLLKVNSSDIDKVVLKLALIGDAIKIKNILRSEGSIYVKTKLISEMTHISEVVEIRRTNLLPNFLIF